MSGCSSVVRWQTAANGTRIEAQDSGFVISNAAGQLLFSVNTNATPTNTLYVQAGSGTGTAGIYVAEGSGGSPNLGLFPASGGELQIGSNSGLAGQHGSSGYPAKPDG